MNYEKKYKESLERAKDYFKANQRIGELEENNMLSDIFPELKESEDEKIRKELLSFCQDRAYYFPHDPKYVNINNWIAWLEKQGEQKPQDKSALETINKEKVEPKFKVGKWYQCTKDFFGKGVTFDKNTAYYCAKEGCLQDEYGCHIAIVKDLYDNFKLWTIEDVKDGDVLCTYEYGEPEIIFILKGTPKKPYVLRYYCYYNIKYPYFEPDTETGCIVVNDGDLKPATKEQYDLLFQKMKEVGYEWDTNKKELIKL